eukprot:jgi/Botrbrau1/3508/Bobra.341_2s0037.1
MSERLYVLQNAMRKRITHSHSHSNSSHGTCPPMILKRASEDEVALGEGLPLDVRAGIRESALLVQRAKGRYR